MEVLRARKVTVSAREVLRLTPGSVGICTSELLGNAMYLFFLWSVCFFGFFPFTFPTINLSPIDFATKSLLVPGKKYTVRARVRVRASRLQVGQGMPIIVGFEAKS